MNGLELNWLELYGYLGSVLIAISLMMSDIRKQMDHLEQLDAKYAPFANKLRELARGFEDEKIVALVEQYIVNS